MLATMLVPPIISRGLALSVALFGVVLAFPLAPWQDGLVSAIGEWLAELMGQPDYQWWWGMAGTHLVVLGCLSLAALGLPTAAPSDRDSRWTGLIFGGVLVAQPALLLALLAAASVWPAIEVLPLVLDPGPIGRGLLTTMRDLLVLVVLTAAVEEWFFRGRLQPWLAGRLGNWPAVSLATLCFAAAHGTVYQAVVAIPLGLFLGWARMRGAGLYACIAGHALHNALFLLAGGALTTHLIIALALLLGGGWLLATAWHGEALPRARSQLIAVGLVIAGSLAIWLPWRWAVIPLWAQAAAAQLTATDRPVAFVHRYLLRLQTHHRVDDQRRLALLLALADHEPSERRDWARLVVDPLQAQDLVRANQNDTWLTLQHIWLCPSSHPYLRRAALDIGSRQPIDLARFFADHPEALATWLSPRTYAGDIGRVLAALPSDRPDGITARTALIRCLFRDYQPAEVTAVLFSMPAAAVTPRDRYQLRRSHPNPNQALAELAVAEPELAAAWGWTAATESLHH